MTNYQNSETDLPQTQETAQMELLESIEALRAILYRFVPLLNSESIETATRSTLALERIHREIRQFFSSHDLHNDQDQLECWENEGGRVRYVSG